MSLSAGDQWIYTFIDSREAFPHPITAAAEFNPQSTVSGHDGLG